MLMHSSYFIRCLGTISEKHYDAIILSFSSSYSLVKSYLECVASWAFVNWHNPIFGPFILFINLPNTWSSTLNKRTVLLDWNSCGIVALNPSLHSYYWYVLWNIYRGLLHHAGLVIQIHLGCQLSWYIHCLTTESLEPQLSSSAVISFIFYLDSANFFYSSSAFVPKTKPTRGWIPTGWHS